MKFILPEINKEFVAFDKQSGKYGIFKRCKKSDLNPKFNNKKNISQDGEFYVPQNSNIPKQIVFDEFIYTEDISEFSQVGKGYIIEEAYKVITDDKVNSFGKIMTVKEACDLWWNKIEFEYNGSRYLAYRILDPNSAPDYWVECVDNDKGVSGPLKENILNSKIKLDKGYDIDSDGFEYITGSIQKIIKNKS